VGLSNRQNWNFLMTAKKSTGKDACATDTGKDACGTHRLEAYATIQGREAYATMASPESGSGVELSGS